MQPLTLHHFGSCVLPAFGHFDEDLLILDTSSSTPRDGVTSELYATLLHPSTSVSVNSGLGDGLG